MRPLILSFTLLLVGCKHDRKAVLSRTLSNDEWFVESWDPPMATIRNHSNIYKVRCKASYLMFNHDPHVPQTLWQQQRPCGELISRYVGKIVTSASEFGPVEVTEGADSLYEFLSRMPDADGWVTEMALDEGERIYEIQKNVPPKTDEFGGVGAVVKSAASAAWFNMPAIAIKAINDRRMPLTPYLQNHFRPWPGHAEISANFTPNTWLSR